MDPTENKDAEMPPTEEPKPETPAEEPAADGENPDEEKKEIQEEKPKGKPISDLVNQGMASSIIEMGFTKAVAEKALLYTNNASVEKAFEWIQEHQEDPDFLEEEFLAPDQPTEDPNKPKLTKEEKIQAAKDLQKRLREKRIAEDKRLEEEREKERIRSTKELQKAKKKMEENEARLRLELERKEKKEFNEEKRRMEELLRKEAAERAGKKYVPGETTKIKKKPSLQAVKDAAKIVMTLYTEDRRPGVAKTCFKTFYTLCKNVLKDTDNQKFRIVNLANEKIAARIGKISGGLGMLKGVGFYENDEGNLELMDEHLDPDLLKEAMELVELKMN
ncbi:unnamed protein product [Moneuplotes crassus]|uniref:UBA domain-containing protein n=1 Tax=Euplotes crassus TaxID=5936 RepID=A0AAD2CX80_EUPCR|nr:unnamed protein product [Moneuplotes crassus]